MKCHNCHARTKIIYTSAKDNVCHRTHACPSCALRFTTVEMVVAGTHRYKGTRTKFKDPNASERKRDPERSRVYVRAYYARNAYAIKLSKGLKIPVPQARDAIELTRAMEISIDEALRITATRKEPNGSCVLDPPAGG